MPREPALAASEGRMPEAEALWLAQPASSERRAFHKPGFARRP